jgi:hypothetical protein
MHCEKERRKKCGGVNASERGANREKRKTMADLLQLWTERSRNGGGWQEKEGEDMVKS